MYTDGKNGDNPCHPSYYMNSDRAAACNVFASNLGMIVKRNSLNKLWIAVSNILDTKPVEKAKVTVYNFQLQAIGKGETNGEDSLKSLQKEHPSYRGRSGQAEGVCPCGRW